MKRLLFWLTAAVGVTILQPAGAAVVVGGRTFADNAFADTVALPAVNYLLWTGSGNAQFTNDQSLASPALTDNPATAAIAPATFAACDPFFLGNCGSATFSFTDNLILNGSGPDFTVFDLNVPNEIRVTIGSDTVTVLAVLAGTVSRPPNLGGGSWNLNAADFDLSDFGLGVGESAGILSIDWTHETISEGVNHRPGVSLIAALNSLSVPEPGSLGLLMAAIAGTLLVRLRQS
jgi:PEP-CTERM motif